MTYLIITLTIHVIIFSSISFRKI